jgi:hypothetical protein
MSAAERPPVGMGLVLDCADPNVLAPFWAAALDSVNLGDAGTYTALFPKGRPGPKLLLQKVGEPKSGKNRMHLDIEVPDIEAEATRLEGARRHPSPSRRSQRAWLDVDLDDRSRGQRVLRLRRRHERQLSAPP